MKIKELRLKNCGRHEQIKFDSDASVVGVVGPNGSGKSTVLSMIEFLFTGELRDPVASYVRRYEGNFSAEADFIKNGKTGTIFRQGGATSKRKLTWDGREVTAAKEVDATIKELFGADKKAVTSAVFIQQGTLETVLFETEGERRKSFIQLVNLSYCSKRADIVDGRIKRISDTIIDLTPTLDAARNQRQNALDSLDAVKRNMEQAEDWSEEVKMVQSRNEAKNKWDQCMSQSGQVENEIGIVTVELKAKLGALNAETLDEVSMRISTMEAESEALAKRIADIQKVRVEFDIFDRATNNIQSSMATITELDKELKSINPDGQDSIWWSDQKIEAERGLQAHTDNNRLVNEIFTASNQLRTLNERKNQLAEPKTTKAEIAEMEKDLAQRNSDIHWLKKILQTRKSMAGCVEGRRGESVKCPNCDLVVEDGGDLEPQEIENLQARIKAEEAEKERVRLLLEWTKTQWFEYERKLTELNTLISETTRQISSLNTKKSNIQLSSKTVEEMQGIKANAEAVIRRIITIPKERQTAVNIWKTATEDKHKCALAMKHNRERSLFDNSIVVDCTRQNQKLQESIKSFRFAEKIAIGLHAQLLEKQKRLNQLSLDIVAADTKLEEIGEMVWGSRLDAAVERTEGMTDDAYWSAADLAAKGKQNLFLELKGQLSALLSQYDQANAHYHDIEDRIKKNLGKMKVIEDLRKLKGLLMDDGIPMAYVRYQFEHLARITQEGLKDLRPNFIIEIDRTKDIAFSFQRIDDPGVIHPMNKLSGGQRVRLCVAFLMALQRRLVKDVGLLVLDEPSTHCDEEGVLQIVEFLKGLRETLQHTDHQLWVVDHAPVMESALEKCLVLKN